MNPLDSLRALTSFIPQPSRISFFDRQRSKASSDVKCCFCRTCDVTIIVCCLTLNTIFVFSDFCCLRGTCRICRRHLHRAAGSPLQGAVKSGTVSIDLLYQFELTHQSSVSPLGGHVTSTLSDPHMLQYSRYIFFSHS